MIPALFTLFAGLMGAGGIILAAASVHAAPGMGLDSAGYILLVHAAALLGGTALLRQSALSRRAAILALTGWVIGAALFPAIWRCGHLPPIACSRWRRPAAGPS